MGSGFPVNQIQYSNSSGTDFGVNYTVDPTSPGPRSSVASPMERTSAGLTSRRQATRVCGSLMDAWKASRRSGNCGWINLGDGTFAVQTDTIRPGRDTDSDGMADAFEFLYLGGLGANPNADTDGDGTTDLEEYLNGTNPTKGNDRLQITQFLTSAGGANSLLAWTSTASRLYQIEFKADLFRAELVHRRVRHHHARCWHADQSQHLRDASAAAVLPRPCNSAAPTPGLDTSRGSTRRRSGNTAALTTAELHHVRQEA